MEDPEPVPRPGLDTNGDADAWAEQYHLLRYVLRMTPTRIALIDLGMMEDHPEARYAAFRVHYIETFFPLVDARAVIERARRRGARRRR